LAVNQNGIAQSHLAKIGHGVKVNGGEHTRSFNLVPKKKTTSCLPINGGKTVSAQPY